MALPPSTATPGQTPTAAEGNHAHHDPLPAAVFAATLATLYAAHAVADHWVQTDGQALDKSLRTRAGQLACLRHITSYTITLAAALAVVGWLVHLPYSIPRVALALAVNAASHYWADRRVYLLALARRTGQKGWLANDPKTAGYHLDQSWHLGWLLITALIAT